MQSQIFLDPSFLLLLSETDVHWEYRGLKKQIDASVQVQSSSVLLKGYKDLVPWKFGQFRCKTFHTLLMEAVMDTFWCVYFKSLVLSKVTISIQTENLNQSHSFLFFFMRNKQSNKSSIKRSTRRMRNPQKNLNKRYVWTSKVLSKPIQL